jgi:formylglycine-generating enzyme required for sulfatase activity
LYRALVLLTLLSIGCGGRSALLESTEPSPVIPDGPPAIKPGDGGPDQTLLPDSFSTPDSRPHPLPPDPLQPPLPAGARCKNGWCVIQPGTFKMGSPPWEPCRNWSYTFETQHQVTLTRAFELAATEVSQGQFQAAMGYNPSWFDECGKDCPVERMRWHEAVAYCNKLSDKAGLERCYTCSGSKEKTQCSTHPQYEGEKIYGCPGYRLPTEAEWEYAYRAGTSTAYYSGDNTSCTKTDPKADLIGWYDLTSGGKSHPAAKKAPNAWGLYDMPGNVLEWTHDPCHHDLGAKAAVDPSPSVASSKGRVLKGGSWFSFVRLLRGAYRNCGDTHSYITGFRCARTLTP